MPTAHTVGTIYNLTLDILAERPCAGPTDTGRPEARWLNRNYFHVVQTSLRANAWNFATELHALARNVSAPAFRWRYGYDLPNGWLRVLPITVDGYANSEPVPFEVRSGAIVTDFYGHADDGLYVELIMDRQDPGEWDPLFAQLVAARLAASMAHSLTHKRSFVDAARQAVADALDAAETANAFEGTVAPVEQHDVIRVRSR